jgi:hypothetical protein
MAQKKVYIGSIGPLLFDDAADINDADFPGEKVEGIKSNSTLSPNESADVSQLQSDMTAAEGDIDDLETWQATGVSGSFTTTDGKTVTVTDGLITSIV